MSRQFTSRLHPSTCQPVPRLQNITDHLRSHQPSASIHLNPSHTASVLGSTSFQIEPLLGFRSGHPKPMHPSASYQLKSFHLTTHLGFSPTRTIPIHYSASPPSSSAQISAPHQSTSHHDKPRLQYIPNHPSPRLHLIPTHPSASLQSTPPAHHHKAYLGFKPLHVITVQSSASIHYTSVQFSASVHVATAHLSASIHATTIHLSPNQPSATSSR